MRRCLADCTAAESRRPLHALARAIDRGVGTTRRVAGLDAAVAACLGAADPPATDRWSVMEAAAWGLALATRSRRRDGVASGRHLDRLVAEARAGGDALAERDTRPARFVMVLARLFGDVEACRTLEAAAAAAVDEEIGRLVAPSGSVVLTGSAAVVERVARWTGFRSTAEDLGAVAWTAAAEDRWALAAAGTLRLLGPRGRGLTGAGVMPADATAGLVDALQRSPRARVRRTARLVRRGGRAPARPGGRLLPTDDHDAGSATAVIRSGWNADAVRVLLDYRDATPRLEIAVGDRLLVDGAWHWAGTSAGRPLDAEGAWTVACWESDRKAAYIEIAAPLAGGLRLERQIVLLRRHRIVLLADAIVPGPGADREGAADGGGADVAWRAEVQLAAGLDAETAAETREAVVYDGAMRCMALPLALPEWRVAGRGSLAAAAGRLVLEQSGWRRLYAPLWIDCDPRRVGRPLTWRQLTVADMRRNLPPHQAAGFRIQSGHEQWLLYRALDQARNRTLLGCNVSSGFLLGRIRRSGEVARTVEIE